MTKLAMLIGVSCVLLATAANAQQREPQSAICIEHIGESDKSIFPVFVSASKDGIRWCQNHADNEPEGFARTYVVASNLMFQLIAEMNRVRGNEETRARPFGTFRITTLESGNQNRKILGKTEMLELLENLQRHSRNEPLYSYLSEVRVRLLRGQ